MNLTVLTERIGQIANLLGNLIKLAYQLTIAAVLFLAGQFVSKYLN